MKTYNIYGSSKKVNYQHCTVTRETEKAMLFETVDSEGSYLNEYNIMFWLPKSIVEKHEKLYMGNNFDVILPFYFNLTVTKNKI